MEKIVVANLKMNLEENDAINYVKVINSKKYNVNLFIAPSNIYLERFKSNNYNLTAQNVSSYEDGDYTGEVSAKQLKSLGASAVIIGHSERRKLFNETNEDINNKIKIALENDLIVLLCIGSDFKSLSKEKEYIDNELSKDLMGISDYSNIIIAYEPELYIGTGNSLEIENISEIYKYIKEKYNMKVIYGGSVSLKNTNEIVNACDGIIVGKMSQKASEFVKLLDIL